MTYPNWFDGQKYNFEDNLKRFAGKPDLKFLQVGVFTGDASAWLCENILTHSTSSLLDIDTWDGSDEPEHMSMDFNNVYVYYKKRMEPYDNVKSVRNNSDNFFRSYDGPMFDFIYIDGDHTSAQVERDTYSAWKLLKHGGTMAFDDYLWGQDLPPDSTPKPAIDNFLRTHDGEYTQLVNSYQVWIQKNDN